MGSALNLACSITYFRIGLVVPILALLLSSPPLYLAAACLTALAGLSDAFDGYLARRRHQATTYGAVLDLIADKLLMLAVVATLAALGLVPAWVPGLVLLREAMVAVLRVRGAMAGRFLAPDRWGKLKTALFLVALVGLLAGEGLRRASPTSAAEAVSSLGWWLLVVALVLSLVSAVNYLLCSVRPRGMRGGRGLRLSPTRLWPSTSQGPSSTHLEAQ